MLGTLLGSSKLKNMTKCTTRNRALNARAFLDLYYVVLLNIFLEMLMQVSGTQVIVSRYDREEPGEYRG